MLAHFVPLSVCHRWLWVIDSCEDLCIPLRLIVCARFAGKRWLSKNRPVSALPDWTVSGRLKKEEEEGCSNVDHSPLAINCHARCDLPHPPPPFPLFFSRFPPFLYIIEFPNCQPGVWATGGILTMKLLLLSAAECCGGKHGGHWWFTTTGRGWTDWCVNGVFAA